MKTECRETDCVVRFVPALGTPYPAPSTLTQVESEENVGFEANSGPAASLGRGGHLPEVFARVEDRPKLHLPAFQRLMQVMTRLNDGDAGPSLSPATGALLEGLNVAHATTLPADQPRAICRSET